MLLREVVPLIPITTVHRNNYVLQASSHTSQILVSCHYPGNEDPTTQMTWTDETFSNGESEPFLLPSYIRHIPSVFYPAYYLPFKSRKVY